MVKKARKEKPEIELYMYSLNQEFPVRKGHGTFLKRQGETFQGLDGKLVRTEQLAAQVYRMQESDWTAQWVHNQWVENWTQSIGNALPAELDPFDRLLAREENFGGIIFDPAADRVYRVNAAGFRLYQELRKAHGENALGAFQSQEFAPEDVHAYIAFLKGAGIWPA
jgi:hypothetical protein